MDIQQLRLFTSLCRHLHFGNAGVESHMSPSAVSRNIQRLEDAIGHKLFLRDNRSVSLTEQGVIFHRYAMDVLARWDALNLELGQTEGELTGRLTLFASVTASQSILPNVLSRFRHDYPGIHIQLETGYAVNALKRLFEGCDVVVAALPHAEDEQLIKRIIMSVPIQAVAPRAVNGVDELLRGDIDWSRVPLILPTTGQARENIDSWFSKKGIRPNIYSEVSGNEAILSLVALGCGVGFVPKLVIKGSPLASKVRIVESGPKLSDFHVGFCARRSSLASSEIIQAFWQSI
ncbi:MAG: HTH-type transcriptional activator IlvY [Gammaproteobacteria bacterium]|nr:HTH-type transcriptional activator IlvY [Gammaproteobacteria bacterium]